jgi:transposase
MIPPPSALRHKWQRLISGQQSSGLSVTRFCRRHGISTPSFYAWRKRLAADGPERFVEVHLTQADGHAAEAGVIEVCLNGRRRVAVHPGFDATTLRQVISLLEGMA